ncbi:MAG: hypothetical protein WDZ52_10885 [Pseudohongiellaceae bacterium]
MFNLLHGGLKMAIRELTAEEIEEVSGAGWNDVGAIVGGIGAIAVGTSYTISTGGVGGILGGGAAMAGGLAAIGNGFNGLYEEWYGTS